MVPDGNSLRLAKVYVGETSFEPATLNGKPVDVYFSLNVSFTLN